MQEPVLKPVLASLLLFASFVTSGHSAEFNDVFARDGDSIFAIEADPNNEVFYAQADESQLPYNTDLRENFAVSLAAGKGALIAPSWVLTASQTISWDEQKNPDRISLRYAGRSGGEYRGERVFRHPYKNLALVLLQSPIVNSREPVLLMMDVLREGHGEVNIKKVGKGREGGNILAFGVSSQKIVPADGYAVDGRMTSGSPWIIESPLVGDVLVGVSDASGKAPQVAYARKWMQQIVEANTPDEVLYWASFAQALPNHINSQPPEVPMQAEVVESEKRSLIILP